MPRRSALAAACALAGALGGCATGNTPQQDLAHERWANCGAPFVQLQGVEVDGRITFLYTNPGGREDVLRCLGDAGRTGPALPEPRAVRPPGGP